MTARGSGSLVARRERHGAAPQPQWSAYGVSKAALSRLTDSLAAGTRRHRRDGSRDEPGLGRTDMTENMWADVADDEWGNVRTDGRRSVALRRGRGSTPPRPVRARRCRRSRRARRPRPTRSSATTPARCACGSTARPTRGVSATAADASRAPNGRIKGAEDDEAAPSGGPTVVSSLDRARLATVKGNRSRIRDRSRSADAVKPRRRPLVVLGALISLAT